MGATRRIVKLRALLTAATPVLLPAHVLVVEDDPETQELLIELLQGAGLHATGLPSGEALLRQLDAQRPDLILLDVALPGMSGLEACRLLRQRGETLPILLLTALDDEADRVLGLELGADDHLGKPFSSRELLARVRVRLRAPASDGLGGGARVREPVRIGAWTFDPATRDLLGPAGERVALGVVDLALLSELVAHAQRPLSRQRLLQALGAPQRQMQERSVDAALLRLRRHVEPNPAAPRYLRTVRGRGYVFVP